MTTKKRYPARYFYNEKGECLAFYYIETFYEEPRIFIRSAYINDVDGAEVKKRDIERDVKFQEDSVIGFLKRHFPQELAEVIFKYAKKDLGVKNSGFSLEAYIHWSKR